MNLEIIFGQALSTLLIGAGIITAALAAAGGLGSLFQGFLGMQENTVQYCARLLALAILLRVLLPHLSESISAISILCFGVQSS